MGHRAFIGYDARSRAGIVVLSNAATATGVAGIAMHLLNPEIPLESPKELAPPMRREAVTIDPAIFVGYVERYVLAPYDTLTVTADGQRLFEQRTGELRVELLAESPHDFFCRLFDEQVSFNTNARGIATSLVYTVAGRRRVGRPAR